MIRHRGRWTPQDRQEAIYRYLPFDVPPGTKGISVRYAYERGPDAILDLGVADPERVRGWSGSERRQVVIGPRAATPGYLAGPMTAGQWQVVIGLYRVPAEGLAYEVEVELGAVDPGPLPAPPPRPERPPRRDLPAAPGRQWLAGDLHSHTIHSDGALTPAALGCLAAERGLDFLAVTDHNTVAHHPELPGAGAHAGILLLPGQEVTTDEGHANALGALPWIDFREPSDAWLAAAEAGGGLLSINHPVAGPYSWRRPLTRRPPLAEVWHSSWDRRSNAPLDWWAAWGGIPVGGSDFHMSGSDGLPGEPTTWVEAEELSLGAIFAALRAGRVAISAGPLGPAAVRHEDGIVTLGAAGAVLVGPDGFRRPIGDERERVPAGPGPYRLVDPSGSTLALIA
jgi:hypothetical protein